MLERKLQRLKEYDYKTLGIYFVTIITKNQIKYLGEIVNEKVILNEFGIIVKECWHNLENYYKEIKLMEYIIMPNHFHGLVDIFSNINYSLSQIIGSFKSFSSRRINEIQNDFYFQWHKSFYDHIVRNEEDLLRIQEYIIYNPLKWNDDEYYK